MTGTQVFVGSDPLLSNSIINNNSSTIDAQLALLEKYKQNLEAARMSAPSFPPTSYTTKESTEIWDEIDTIINSMTDSQKEALFSDEGYMDNYNRLQNMVNTEMLNLVKGKIENSPFGKELLNKQLSLLKTLKSKIDKDTNIEIELFKRFRESSKENPELTYDEFIKSNI